MLVQLRLLNGEHQRPGFGNFTILKMDACLSVGERMQNSYDKGTLQTVALSDDLGGMAIALTQLGYNSWLRPSDCADLIGKLDSCAWHVRLHSLGDALTDTV